MGRLLEALRRLRDRYLLAKYTKAGLRLGSNVRIMGKPEFGSEPYLIKIGNHITISTDVMFITHDGATWVFRDLPEYRGLEWFGPIEIKDNCFIGARSVLLPGVTIGPNSIVGAGAVVTRSVPPDTVVAGCPARVICTTQEYVQKMAPLSHHYSPEVKARPAWLRAEVLLALKERAR